MNPGNLHLMQDNNNTFYYRYSDLPKLNRPNACRCNFSFNKSRGQICKHIVTTGIFIPLGTEVKIHSTHLTFNSSNIVYLIYCIICNGGNHVGENGSECCLRFNKKIKTTLIILLYHNISNYLIIDETILDASLLLFTIQL